MIKKFFLILLGIIVLSAGYYFVNQLLNPPPEEKVAAPKPVKKEPWDGKATKIIDSKIGLGRKLFAIQKAEFTGLNFPRANIKITLISSPVKRVKVPSWLNKKTGYRGVAPGIGVYRPASVSSGVVKGVAFTRITFVQIPTKSLGPVCSGEGDAPFKVEFIAASPKKRLFSADIVPPPAPEGSCFSEKGKDEVRERAKISRVKVISQGKSSIVTVSGSAVLRKNKIFISVNKKVVKATRVGTDTVWRASFRISKPKGPVFLRVGTKERPNLAFRKTVLVKP